MSKDKDYHVYQGIVQKTKIIKSDDPTMAYLRLKLSKGEIIHALIVNHALTFMLDVLEGDEISIYGHYNQRRQFIVSKYLINTKFEMPLDTLPNHLKYPHKKPD